MKGSTMNRTLQLWQQLTVHLEAVGTFAPQLALRVLLAYEFGIAGLEKFNGSNWFAEIQSDFPFPFYLLPAELSWQMSTWFELAGAVALVLGFATRFFSVSLIVLTIVAWAAVHAGHGYNVSDNGYKLPLMYLVLFLPLLFNGAGKVSLDYLLSRRMQHKQG
jgi:putative oxidoreductase